MAKEIERKFLVTNDNWKHLSTEVFCIKQFYITYDKDLTYRVRVKTSTSGMSKAYLTIKSNNCNVERDEFEYEIPYVHASKLQNFAKSKVIKKLRHIVRDPDDMNAIWEIDVYCGEYQGLVIAEREFARGSSINGIISGRFDWLGREVTNDPQYYNENLAKRLDADQSNVAVVNVHTASSQVNINNGPGSMHIANNSGTIVVQ